MRWLGMRMWRSFFLCMCLLGRCEGDVDVGWGGEERFEWVFEESGMAERVKRHTRSCTRARHNHKSKIHGSREL